MQPIEPEQLEAMTPQRASRLEIVVLSLLGSLGLAALLIVFWFPPTEHRFYPRCAFHDLTGLHCPGCGGFRAWHALLNGQVLSAMHMNILAVTLLPGLVGWLVFQRLVGRQGDFWTLRASPWVHLFLAGVVLAFGFLRNIPIIPFKWLSP